jgi:hypothetical protein
VRYLSICAIVKDENSYLPEWLAYHRTVGVEHFYIYDNMSSVPLDQTLAGEIDAGMVTVIRQEGRAQQGPAYQDCVLRRKDETFWIAFVDVDEFILPKKSDDLRTILHGYEPFGGLGINWQIFGYSGCETRPSGLQMEAFTRRAARQYFMNHHIKSVVRPSFISHYLSPHAFKYRVSFCVNEARLRVDGAFSVPVLYDVAQINHYLFRSKQETREKCARGCGDGLSKKQEDMDKWALECDHEEDRDILRFAAATKKLKL